MSTPTSQATVADYLSRGQPELGIEIAEMFLGFGDVTPDTMDNGGLTPLAWAADTNILE